MGKRHQARELALKVLFQLEGSEDDSEEVLLYHAAEGAATSIPGSSQGDTRCPSDHGCQDRIEPFVMPKVAWMNSGVRPKPHPGLALCSS